MHASTRSGASMSEPKSGQLLQRTVCPAKPEALATLHLFTTMDMSMER